MLFLQILRVGNCHWSFLPALARRRLSRSETGQRHAGSGWSYQNRGFWNVQGGHIRRQTHQDFLRHARLHSARGEKKHKILLNFNNAHEIVSQKFSKNKKVLQKVEFYFVLKKFLHFRRVFSMLGKISSFLCELSSFLKKIVYFRRIVQFLTSFLDF